MEYSRLKAKPWNESTATHGRYKDLFDLSAQTPRDKKGTRPMRMSPDLDFRVDTKDIRGNVHEDDWSDIGRKSTKIAKEDVRR